MFSHEERIDRTHEGIPWLGYLAPSFDGQPDDHDGIYTVVLLCLSM